MFSLHPKGKNLIWGHKILIFEKLTNLLEYRYMKNLHLLIFLAIAACGGGGGGNEESINTPSSIAISSSSASSSSSGNSSSSSTNQPPVYSEPQNNTINMDENILIIPGLTLTDPDDSLTVTVYSSRGYREELNDVNYNVELGNSDGTTKVISSDLTYTSTDTIKLVSDIQLAQGVKLTLNGVKIFTDCASCSGNKIQVYNGHLDINNSKLRNIYIGFEGNTSIDLEEAGSIEISGSNWIGGEFKGGEGGVCFGGGCSTGTIGSYDIRNNYFQDLDGFMYFWSAVNKFIFSGNSLVNSGGISIGYSSDSMIESPVIKNNFFAHKNENNPVGNIYFDYPNSPFSGYLPVYVTLLKSDGSKDLILSSNAFLNSNISAFISVYNTTDSIKSDSDYFGITNTLDTPSRYLDNSDNLEYKSVVVTNPATYVSDSQTPSFESPIKYNSDGTFEFLIAPDYEANARELNYTIRYSDGVNPEKEKTIKIVINDVLD